MSERMERVIPTHPVQNSGTTRTTALPQVVTLRAYEVYKHIHGEQVALIEGWCRGGFSVGEVIAFLYAYGFPKEEWARRADEAFLGMKHGETR